MSKYYNKEKQKKYRQDNRERILKRRKEFYKAHREELHEQQRQHYLKNSKRIRETRNNFTVEKFLTNRLWRIKHGEGM